MTTFGGQTIPPLFDGGGDGIFIRGVGLPLTNDVNNSSPAQDIPAAPANVGDLLVVFDTANGIATAPIPPTLTNWNNSFSISGGSLDIWTRIATGDILDNYRAPNNPGNLDQQYNRQMISLGSGVSGMSVAFQNGGPQTTGDSVLFPILTMPVGANLGNNLVLGLYVHFYFQTTGPAPLSLQALAGLDTIGSYTDGFAQSGTPTRQFRFFSGWSSVFQAAASSVAGSNITYAPTRNGRNRTAFARFVLV